jgi:uncharacterized protein YjbI with pentapeptide repeats
MTAGGLGEYALTLGGANLEKIDLQGADFSGTDLMHDQATSWGTERCS